LTNSLAPFPSAAWLERSLSVSSPKSDSETKLSPQPVAVGNVARKRLFSLM
jgi:hypothetical protein